MLNNKQISTIIVMRGLGYTQQEIADALDLSLDEIATNNIRKLQSRKERNQIHGSGDNR